MKRCLLLLIPLVLSGSQLRAESGCPWITQGTAAALLGGEVAAEVQSSSSDAGSCRFSLLHGTTEYVLEVIVAGAAGATCPPGSPNVPGVGSEAVSCATKQSSGETTDMISGRVRSIFFVVRLSAKGASDPHMNSDKRSEIVERAAEAVTGNLF